MSSPTRIKDALRRHVRRVSKHVYQNVCWRALDRPKVLMIVGCQRSGTALMSRLFDADRDCRVFGEFSSLSSVGKDGIRLNPLPDVAAVFPDPSHTRQVHSSSVSRSRNLELLPEVRALCEQLQARLDAQYELQSKKVPAVAAATQKARAPRLQPAVLQ